MVAQDYKIAFMRNLLLFKGLSEGCLRSLLEEADILSLPKRASLFERGDAVTHFYGILSGWVKLFRLQPDGAEVVIEVFGPSESFAEGAIRMDGYPVSAEIVEDAQLLAIPVSAYIERLRTDPEMAMRTCAILADHLNRLVRRIELDAGCSSTQRVCAFLFKFHEPAQGGIGSARVKLPYEKSLVAGRLGMRAETFSRALNSLQNLGVTVNRREIRIADPELLRRHAGFS